MAAENAALWRMAPWMQLGIGEFRNGRKAPESSLHRLNREALALNPKPISCVHLGPETGAQSVPKPESRSPSGGAAIGGGREQRANPCPGSYPQKPILGFRV